MLPEPVVDAQSDHPGIAQARHKIARLISITYERISDTGLGTRLSAILIGRRSDRRNQKIADIELRRRTVCALELEMSAMRIDHPSFRQYACAAGLDAFDQLHAVVARHAFGDIAERLDHG